jgi:transcription elongation factor SPT5
MRIAMIDVIRSSTLKIMTNCPAHSNRPQFQAAPRSSWGGLKTPNLFGEDARTPAWGGSRTLNPYVEGGKTPAWQANLRSPNS